ncbi:MAG: DUF6471 domain-containing protein [Xanthobacteraceae bacterium]
MTASCTRWSPNPNLRESLQETIEHQIRRLARADVGYRELAERLKKHGLQETEASIANKISRGTFPATFLLASLIAIEADMVRLEDI